MPACSQYLLRELACLWFLCPFFTLHQFPAHFSQIQVSDPDEDKNGQVTMALQMGMPRLDFVLNTTTGVLVSTATLDREQIGQYLLRVVAYDAGQFPRTSTSTLTITGTEERDTV